MSSFSSSLLGIHAFHFRLEECNRTRENLFPASFDDPSSSEMMCMSLVQQRAKNIQNQKR